MPSRTSTLASMPWLPDFALSEPRSDFQRRVRSSANSVNSESSCAVVAVHPLAGEIFHDCVAKDIVTVSSDHVAGVRDLRILAVWDQGLEFANALVAQDIAEC